MYVISTEEHRYCSVTREAEKKEKEGMMEMFLLYKYY